jgi:hypothetical protein
MSLLRLGVRLNIKVHKITQKLIVIIQRSILMAALAVIYFFGFSVTLILVFLFNRKIIFRDMQKDTFWVEAEGYDVVLDEALRES